MNEKIKSAFEKIGFVFSCLGAFLVALFLGKKLHGNGKRAEADSGRDSPSDELSRDADRICEESRNAAQRLQGLIEQIKDRERGIASESEKL